MTPRARTKQWHGVSAPRVLLWLLWASNGEPWFSEIELGLESAEQSGTPSWNRWKFSNRFSELLLDVILLPVLLSREGGKKCDWPRISLSLNSGREKELGVAKNSLRSVVKSVRESAMGWSTGDSIGCAISRAAPGGRGELWIGIGDPCATVPGILVAAVNQVVLWGMNWVTFKDCGGGGGALFLGDARLLSVLLLVFLVVCFLPPRFVTKYSQEIPRFEQRAHVGFSLLHFSLEAAQAWQLSRNLGAAGLGPRPLVEAICTPEGDRRSSMFIMCDAMVIWWISKQELREKKGFTGRNKRELPPDDRCGMWSTFLTDFKTDYKLFGLAVLPLVFSEY